MIDNFNLIYPLLNAHNIEGEFYFLQIVSRAKDHKSEGIKVKEGAIKSYFITSKEHLESLKDEIILLCEHYKARAYINVGIKSFYMFQKQLMYKLAEYNVNNNILTNPFRLINRIAGACKSISTRWIIDIDDNSMESSILAWLDKYYFNFNLELPFDNRRESYLIAKVPTVQGEHLIIGVPFNTSEFWKEFPDVDIHRNSMGTLLYYPKSISVLE